MKQSAILRVCYETIFKNLTDLANETKLFDIRNGTFENPQTGSLPTVYLGVSDVSQICIDKNGQKIEVDEMLYEVPVQIGCMLFLTVIFTQYPPLLETVGLLIQYFKDNNAVSVEDYKWHGENNGKVIIEPVIRGPEQRSVSQLHSIPAITLEFRMEMSINSLRGNSFKRVEKREFKGNII